MLKPEYTNQFKKDYKLIQKRKYNIEKLWDVINQLIDEEPLPDKNRDHTLGGNYVGCRECHIGPDWLIIYYYKIGDTIVFARTGTHADLFR